MPICFQIHTKCCILSAHCMFKLFTYIAIRGAHLCRGQTSVWHSGCGLHSLLLPHVLLLHFFLQAAAYSHVSGQQVKLERYKIELLLKDL